MRFEIRAGGALLILIGLAALSGVVFALGLVAGYEMARQTSPEGAQVANVYPAPSSSQNAESSPVASPAEASVAQPPAEAKAQSAPSVAAAAPSVAQSKPAPKPIANATPATNRNAVASATQQRNTAPRSRTAETDEAADESEASRTTPVSAPPPAVAPKYASASVPPPERHKPFNIQIDAVMDYANAQQMATRLKRLGYHAFLVPTDIDGQRWWRVRVGPFNSQDEAQTAEQELRERYRQTYSQ